jgi:hypothetical protein
MGDRDRVSLGARTAASVAGAAAPIVDAIPSGHTEVLALDTGLAQGTRRLNVQHRGYVRAGSVVRSREVRAAHDV